MSKISKVDLSDCTVALSEGAGAYYMCDGFFLLAEKDEADGKLHRVGLHIADMRAMISYYESLSG